MTSTTRDRLSALVRLIALGAAVLIGAALLTTGPAGQASTAPSLPVARCGPGAWPEQTQGRVPLADYSNGRAARGYRCNTVEIAHQGRSGGFKTLRYVDPAGHVCAFYDYSLTFPRDVQGYAQAGAPLGLQVLDMHDPAHPRHTATLMTPAMQQPHESLLVNNRRGILAAVMGSAITAPGVVDLYDVHTDCRHPRLLSTSPVGILGHESGFSPDGRTFYATGTNASMVAIDITHPRLPRVIASLVGFTFHGLRLSTDGRTMYAATIGASQSGGLRTSGLTILDVSSIQRHTAHPHFTIVSRLSWANVSIPQVAQPFIRNGVHYLLEVDEFADLFSTHTVTNPGTSPVGAARIINVQDPRHPFVVSDLRLAVHQPAERARDMSDPGANDPAQSYAAHYCSVSAPVNPTMAACSMIMSGLRVIDIRDVHHPREIAYFNKPVVKPPVVTVPPVIGAYAMSQPAWDLRRHEIWYTDANSGFYVVKVTNGRWLG